MAKVKVVFECQSCGYRSPKWLGKCPSCDSWESFSEGIEPNLSEQKSRFARPSTPTKPVRLDEISSDEGQRLITGIGELDRVLGGGFMKGSLVLLGGDPGIGKSTLTLQIAKSRPDLSMLYISGEESPTQIRQRASRLELPPNRMSVFAETELSRILEQARADRPDLMIVDSIQTIYHSELSGMPGNITQIRECALHLMSLAKQEGITILMIGHMNKEGDLAGPKVLEHLVDAVLQFEGEHHYAYRLLRSVKNRFGATHEMGVFEMSDQGLTEITNPSQLFLSGYQPKVSGNAVICTMEGTRPLLNEVQSLVSPTAFGMPQRTATGLDQRRLTMLLAVLEKRSGYRFSDLDVFVNVAGGMRIQEPATDLGLAAALVSACINRPVHAHMVFIGEIGLGGELRAVNRIQQRLSEAQKMGFETAIVPESNKGMVKTPGIECIFAPNLDLALGQLF